MQYLDLLFPTDRPRPTVRRPARFYGDQTLRDQENVTFSDLISPMSLQSFADEVWDRRQLLISRSDGAFYESLFTFADVDRLIFLARERPQELLTIVPKVKTAGAESRFRLNQVPVRELYRRFQSGDTIRISDIQASWPPLMRLAQDIVRTLTVRVDVNLYMTPANSQGFPTHVDYEDVFILQVGGAKEWFVYEADYPWPVEGLSYLSEQGGHSTPRRDENLLRQAENVVLEAGDFLYIPRGYPHRAVTSGRPSLHLTIGLHPLYWLDLVQAALEIVCAQEPDLRRALPPSFARNQKVREAMATRFEATLSSAHEKVSFEKAVDAVVATRVPSPGFPPDGHFASLSSLGSLDLSTTLERRMGLDCVVERSGSEAFVRFGRECIRGPLSIAPALGYVRDHQNFQISQLPNLDDNGKIVLSRRLIVEGLLRIVSLNASSM